MRALPSDTSKHHKILFIEVMLLSVFRLERSKLHIQQYPIGRVTVTCVDRSTTSTSVPGRFRVVVCGKSGTVHSRSWGAETGLTWRQIGQGRMAA